MPVLPFIPRPPHFRRARRFLRGKAGGAFGEGARLSVRRFFGKIARDAFERARRLYGVKMRAVLCDGAARFDFAARGRSGRPRCRAFLKRAAGRAMCFFCVHVAQNSHKKLLSMWRGAASFQADNASGKHLRANTVVCARISAANRCASGGFFARMRRGAYAFSRRRSPPPL